MSKDIKVRLEELAENITNGNLIFNLEIKDEVLDLIRQLIAN